MSGSKIQRNSLMGIRLFIFYAVFYLAFVLVNAFATEAGEWQVVGGLNLAVLWGFALIALAFLLAMIYGLFCTDEGPAPESQVVSKSEIKN